MYSATGSAISVYTSLVYAKACQSQNYKDYAKKKVFHCIHLYLLRLHRSEWSHISVRWDNISCFPLRGEHEFIFSRDMEILLEMLASREKIGTSRLDINSSSPLNGKQHFCPTSQDFNESTNKPNCHYRSCFYCSENFRPMYQRVTS